jgi:nucleotide-binding universal stress UspA family protein
MLVMRTGGSEPAFIEERARDVAFTIVEVALQVKADMIVMGASGTGAVKAFIVGSVSKEVLRKATGPVTIVH